MLMRSAVIVRRLALGRFKLGLGSLGLFAGNSLVASGFLSGQIGLFALEQQFV